MTDGESVGWPVSRTDYRRFILAQWYLFAVDVDSFRTSLVARDVTCVQVWRFCRGTSVCEICALHYKRIWHGHLMEIFDGCIVRNGSALRSVYVLLRWVHIFFDISADWLCIHVCF